MESPKPVATEKKDAGILQMEILDKLKHESVAHDPQLFAEQFAKLHRSMPMADSPMAAELFKREAFQLAFRPKLDYFNLAAFHEQQYLTSNQGRVNPAASPRRSFSPRRSDSPSGSEDGGSISPNHAPPSAGGQWTYEEQFKQVSDFLLDNSC